MSRDNSGQRNFALTVAEADPTASTIRARWLEDGISTADDVRALAEGDIAWLLHRVAELEAQLARATGAGVLTMKACQVEGLEELTGDRVYLTVRRLTSWHYQLSAATPDRRTVYLDFHSKRHPLNVDVDVAEPVQEVHGEK